MRNPFRKPAPEEPEKPRITLVELADKYLLERSISRGYRVQVEIVLRMIRDWHGGTVFVDQLCDDFANRFLEHEQRREITGETLCNRRKILLTLWNYAFDREFTDARPQRVRKIPHTRLIPEAWSAEQVSRLIQAVDGTFALDQVHRIAKVKIGLFWKAMIMFIWDTGLRKVDWERVTRDQIGEDGTIHLVQHKTGWPLKCTVRPETIAAIDATEPTNRKFIFGSGSSQRNKTFKRIVAAAGLRGTMKKLRKSSATAVERIQPGAAMAHLGHKTPGLAARHYVDPRMTQDAKIQPPSLSLPVEQPKQAPAPAPAPLPARGTEAIGIEYLAWL